MQKLREVLLHVGFLWLRVLLGAGIAYHGYGKIFSGSIDGFAQGVANMYNMEALGSKLTFANQQEMMEIINGLKDIKTDAELRDFAAKTKVESPEQMGLRYARESASIETRMLDALNTLVELFFNFFAAPAWRNLSNQGGGAAGAPPLRVSQIREMGKKKPE